MKRIDIKAIVTVAAVASALIITTASPAQASRSGGDPSVTPGVEIGGGGPLVQLNGEVVPGSSGSSIFTVTNVSDDDAVLSLRLVGLRDDDNGCQRPETLDNDVTCGDGEGELGRDLRLAVVPVGSDGHPSGAPAFDETVRNLAAWALVDGNLPGDTERSFRLEWELPVGSPNDTQTDSVSFDIEFVLEAANGGDDDTGGESAGGGGDTGTPGADGPEGPGASTNSPAVGGTDTDSGGSGPDTAVMGVQLEPTGTPVKVPGTELPRTGLDPVPAVEAGFLALLAGVLILAATRRPGRVG